MRAVALAVLACFALPVAAQTLSEKRMLQSKINAEGHRCDAVTGIKAAGRLDESGDIMFVVSCSDGGRHVMRLHANESVSYYMSCKNWLNPVPCD